MTTNTSLYRLLICGSRFASASMLDYAQRATRRAGELGWQIVVGDAVGVDKAVALTCVENAIPFTMYGITHTPRILGPDFEKAYGHIGCYIRVNGNFLARDRVMVDASNRCLAIWNGTSRGTLFTYQYAIKQKKVADLWQPLI